MRKILTIICIATFAQILTAQTNPSKGYPNFETIVRVFFKNFQPPDTYYFIQFQKKEDGYHVAEMDHDLNVKKSHLLWSKKLGGFVDVPFEKAIPSEVEKNTESFLRDNSYDETQFDLHPYYGYSGWTLDVIEEFGEREKLSDNMLYSLGRAYSYRCNELCQFDSKSQNAPGSFDLPFGKNSMTEEQLEIYLKYGNKAIETFYRLHEQNPDFETIVGSIYVKYCNEIIFQYLQLHLYQNEKVAKQILREGLYDPFTLATARNFLRSCPPNAVLATWGDNDTYPLLYVQAIENFRTDVLIANLSLLQLGRYIQHISGGIYDAPTLPLSLDFYFYTHPDNVVAMAMPKDSSTSIDRLIQVLKNPPPEYKIYTHTKYPIIPSNVYFYDLKIDSAGIMVSKKINLDFGKKQQYLFIYDIFFLDLIYSTKGKRPICFSASCTHKSMKFLEKHLALNGLAYVMNADEINPDQLGVIGGPDVDATERLLFEELEYVEYPNHLSHVKIYHQYYLFAFLRLAKWKLNHGEKERAIEIADRFVQLFPFSKTHSVANVSFVEIYYSAGQTEKAKGIWEPIIEYWKMDAEALADDMWYFNQLLKISASNNDEELKNKLEELIE